MTSNCFASVAWQCVHFTSDSSSVFADAGMDQKQIVVRRASVGNVADEIGMFRAIAAAMEFPDYFGNNWDALDECLRDLEWLPANGYVLVLTEARGMWRHSPLCCGMLIESWLLAAELWAKENIPFHLVFGL
jgi:hypothetical protein